MTLSRLRKRYFGASLASRSVKYNEWEITTESRLNLIFTRLSSCQYVLSAYYWEKGSQLQLTPQVDPPQDEEDEYGNQHYSNAGTNCHPHHLKTKKQNSYTLYSLLFYADNAVPAELTQQPYNAIRKGRCLWLKLTMLVCSSSATNVLMLLSPSLSNRETETNYSFR